jgi:phage terminase large subunit
MPRKMITNVFIRNLKAFQAGKKLIINQGGQGSSKTYSILQVIYGICREPKARRISICSYALPHLKQGAMADWERILKFFGVEVEEVKNKTENTYQIGASTVEFFGLEGSEAKAHGPRRDILFINEANRRVEYDVYAHLAGRTHECVFLDFNPYISGWIQEVVMLNFEYELIHSTYLDNPFLPQTERENIESKRDKPEFAMWYKVYGLGELGSLAGAILPNWSYGPVDESLPYVYGLDFGFRDQDAFVKVAIDKKRKIIYADEKIYKSGNSNDQLRQLIAYHCERRDLIIADCADARMINELSRYFNIKPVNKKKWTIGEALKMMQDYEIVITDGSRNLAKELDNYIWNDKKAGIPIDAYNHLIDGIRYVFQYSMNSGGSIQIWYR